MNVSDVSTHVVGDGMYAARHDGKLLMVAVTDKGVYSWWEGTPQKLWLPDDTELPEAAILCIAERFGCEPEESADE